MKKVHLTLCSVALAVLLGTSLTGFGASNGKAVFESLHCGGCHKVDSDKIAASLPQLARAYGDQAKLVEYFKGNSEPIVAPSRQAVMKGQLKKIAGLSLEQKQALADYILSFK